MLRVVFWLWRDPQGRWNGKLDYTPDLLIRTARAVRQNLSIPHELVAVTDTPADRFPSDIRVVPLWDDLRQMGGCWTRLRAFAPDMAEVIGPRFGWLDLDCCVTGDLTPVLDRREDFVAWRSGSMRGTHYNGSLVLMTAGARAKVWTGFDPLASPAACKHDGFGGTDQAWFSRQLGPREASWDARDGVMHYGLHACARSLHPRARIVFFPGAQKPNSASVQKRSPWVGRYWQGDLLPGMNSRRARLKERAKWH